MLKFIGQGFLPGYPMYDLDETEYDDEEIEILLKSGLYVRAEAYRPEEEIRPIRPRREKYEKLMKKQSPNEKQEE